MNDLIELSNCELAQVHGGFGLFSEISKIFGREGKPFLGQDFSKGVAVVAEVGILACPAAAPVLAPIKTAAEVAVAAQEASN